MTTAINGMPKLLKRLLLPFLLLPVLLVQQEVLAQQVVWTGNIDENWHNAGNWNPNRIPSGGDEAVIEPSGGNPFPVISEDHVTISDIWISRWGRGGALTVSSNHTLTITNRTRIHSDGSLFIESEGEVYLSGGTFEMAYNNSLVDISSGSFTSDIDIEILGNGFNAGTGTVSFNADLTVATDKVFNVEASTVTVDGLTNINGTFNGDEGSTYFNDEARVNSGGVLNLSTGEIHFYNGAFVGNNGTVNLGEGMINLEGSVTVESSGYFNVDDATVNITGDADFANGGFLSIQNGSINVEGNASLSSGGEFNLANGSLSVGKNASFTSGGTVNAGQAQINLKGDLTVPYGGTFNADSSTVSFSGSTTQTIYTEGDDITFHNVNVNSGSSLQTDGSTENTIIIENDLSVEEGSQVGIKDDDTIDIQGNLNDQGQVESSKPFVYAISTPSLHEVEITFDKEMDETTAEQVSNYSINRGISISSATLDPSNPKRVLLEVSTLADNLEYELTINHVLSAAGGEISQNHIKRFTTMVDVTYYSRASGDWNAPSSWSIESHTGAAATAVPNAQDAEDVVIGNNHTVTISSTQNLSNVDELTVSNTGTLAVTSGGHLILGQLTIIGDGTFSLQESGTLNIASPDGIAGEGTDKGNIQTTSRSFSSAANYIYNGTTAQVTGSGLPERVQDLSINNASNVVAQDNITVDGILYLQEGSLIIPSGQGIIAKNKSIENGSLTFQRILSGEPGWRMISSPVSTDYGGFLDGVLTQGFQGSVYESLQPNIMYYDETYEGTDNQRWRAPSASTSSVPAGGGYNLYLFGDISEDNRYNDPLPDTLTVQGQEHSSPNQQINLNVTYTAEADTGWNLVGNPYGASIDWDEAESWTKTHIDETIYVWDPDTNAYKTWNGETGSLGSGIIPPFQAFWIKANAEHPELSVHEQAKTFGGEFVGKRVPDKHPEIEVEVVHEGQANSIYFSFFEDARVGKDRLDGYFLQPPPDTRKYVELYSIGRRKNRYSINSLPVKFGTPIEIPISANVIEEYQNISESVNLRISKMKNIPYSWEISLIDRQSGETLNPSEGFQYAFTTSGSTYSSGSDTSDVLKKKYSILADANPEEARFALRIDPGALGLGLPTEIDLKQNYPNPASSQTFIRFALPIQNEITLEVFDILGRKVAVLANNESYQAGLHTLQWNTTDLASGTYIYRLLTEERVLIKKLTVLK